jgi:hypothetical protein
MRWKTTSLLSLVTVACFTPFPIFAQIESTSPTDSTSTLERIVQQFSLRRKDGVRQGGFCVASPGQLESTYVVWSNRPVFVWDRVASRIIVRDDQGVEVWNQAVSSGDRAAIYNSSIPLQPDRRYRWTILTPSQTEVDPDQQFYSFRIMGGEQRDQITNALPQGQPGATPEEISLEQSDYFIERELWSDALQSLYAVQNPSAELTQARQEIVSTLVQNICHRQTN